MIDALLIIIIVLIAVLCLFAILGFLNKKAYGKVNEIRRKKCEEYWAKINKELVKNGEEPIRYELPRPLDSDVLGLGIVMLIYYKAKEIVSSLHI